MLEEKHPLKAFLCHAHDDRAAVKALYSHLLNDGVDAWLDKENILPGQDWRQEIRKAVGESDVVIVCLSNHFKHKGYRQVEVSIALEQAALQPEGEIFIIPARLEDCETLLSLEKWHWVDLFDKNGYEKLIKSLELRAEHAGKKNPKLTNPNSKSDNTAFSGEYCDTTKGDVKGLYDTRDY
jgi:hypothetical protein